MTVQAGAAGAATGTTTPATGGAAGAAGTGDGAAAGTTTPATGAAAGAATTGATTTTPDVASLQAQLARLNDDLAAERKKIADRDKADAKAAEARATQQGEWQALAEQRAAKVAELEPRLETAEKGLADALAVIKAAQEAEIAALPETVKALDPGDDWKARAAWLPKAKALAAELAKAGTGAAAGAGNGGAAATGAAAGAGSTPRPASAGQQSGMSDADKAKAAREFYRHL